MKKIALISLIALSSSVFAAQDSSLDEKNPPQASNVNTTVFTDKNAIQNELNVKWATPLQQAYTAFRCGYEAESTAIIRKMTESTSEATKSSPVAYGFLLGYSEHLDALNYQGNERESICKNFDTAINPSNMPSPDSFSKNTSIEAIDHVISTIGITKSLGEPRVKDLLLTAQSVQNSLGVKLNTSILMSACNLPDANKSMPTAVQIINAAGLMGEPNKDKIKDALDVWFGFSQGSYWHALYLINSTTKKDTVCSNLTSMTTAD
jgi:hypothetical protein